MFLHLLFSGKTGGIEKLCKDIGLYSPQNNMFCFACSGGEMYEQFLQNGLKTELLNLSPKDPVGLYKNIKRIVKMYGVDTIIVHHDSPMLLIASMIAKISIRNIRIFVYAHSNYKDIMPNFRFRKQLFTIAGKLSDKIIAISVSVKNSILEETKFKEQKVAVIYNGIQLPAHASKRTNVHNGEIRLVYVGRLIKEKGVQILLQALPLINPDVHWSLEILGDGEYRTELEKLSAELGLSHKIQFLGTQKNIYDYLSSSDVFIHPAIWDEGFGITIVEAMSEGLVCIAFNKGALPEIIDDGLNGFLIDQIDPQKLASAIEKIGGMIETDNLIHIREAAVEKSNQFTIEKTVEELERLACEK